MKQLKMSRMALFSSLYDGIPRIIHWNSLVGFSRPRSEVNKCDIFSVNFPDVSQSNDPVNRYFKGHCFAALVPVGRRSGDIGIFASWCSNVVSYRIFRFTFNETSLVFFSPMAVMSPVTMVEVPLISTIPILGLLNCSSGSAPDKGSQY